MTNESNKSTIKRSFKIAWEAAQELSLVEGQHIYGLDDIDEIFGELWEAIRQLRKENKKLKGLQHINDALPYLTWAWSFKTCPPADLPLNLQPKAYPSAEFKCAKTHYPEKEGAYWCVAAKLLGNYDYYKLQYGKTFGWSVPEPGLNVIAFTETYPQEIINSLNK